MSGQKIRTVSTRPFADQRPGTSGLRKKTRVFIQPHYIENFVQSILDYEARGRDIDFSRETLVLGGDGRFFNRAAVQAIIRIAAANGFGRIVVGRGGLFSTPAMSMLIRAHKAFGGLLLTASHNPGGPDGDFGIKYNVRNGGPAPQSVTEGIYAETQRISRFLTMEFSGVDIDRKETMLLGDSRVSVVDPVEEYAAAMEKIFDFDALGRLFQGGFRLTFDAMHGVTGIYAEQLLERQIGAPAGTIIHGVPLENFGGLHPDPNQVHASELVRTMASANAPDMGAACDGDGDRNMILGRSFFVGPGDSLAIIAAHASEVIPGYRAGLSGVARSMPTSTAVDRVAQKLGIPCYETPTGWKFFVNLMDAGKCTICGEESFGTGSDHGREKDGIWAVLAWLSILAATKSSVVEVVQKHWSVFGRSYFQRHDYEGLDPAAAERVIAELRAGIGRIAGTALGSAAVYQADDFSYVDPVDGSISSGQGIRILLDDGSRIVGRLSGTGTEGATLRLYFERYRSRSDEPMAEVLKPLVEYAGEAFHLRDVLECGRPSVVT